MARSGLIGFMETESFFFLVQLKKLVRKIGTLSGRATSARRAPTVVLEAQPGARVLDRQSLTLFVDGENAQELSVRFAPDKPERRTP